MPKKKGSKALGKNLNVKFLDPSNKENFDCAMSKLNAKEVSFDELPEGLRAMIQMFAGKSLSKKDLEKYGVGYMFNILNDHTPAQSNQEYCKKVHDKKPFDLNDVEFTDEDETEPPPAPTAEDKNFVAPDPNNGDDDDPENGDDLPWFVTAIVDEMANGFSEMDWKFSRLKAREKKRAKREEKFRHAVLSGISQILDMIDAQRYSMEFGELIQPKTGKVKCGPNKKQVKDVARRVFDEEYTELKEYIQQMALSMKSLQAGRPCFEDQMPFFDTREDFDADLEEKITAEVDKEIADAIQRLRAELKEYVGTELKGIISKEVARQLKLALKKQQ